MAEFTDYLANQILNYFRNTHITAPAAVFCGLFSVLPDGDGTGGTEVTTTVRPAGRVAVTFSTPADGVIANLTDVNFGASAGATDVVGFGLFDAASAGNLLARKSITPRTLSVTDPVSFAAGTLTVSVQ